MPAPIKPGASDLGHLVDQLLVDRLAMHRESIGMFAAAIGERLVREKVQRLVRMTPSAVIDEAIDHHARLDLAPTRASLIAHALRRYELALHTVLDRRIARMRATLDRDARDGVAADLGVQHHTAEPHGTAEPHEHDQHRTDHPAAAREVEPS